MNFRSGPILAAALLLIPGCRKDDPARSLNRDLAAILETRDRLKTQPSCESGQSGENCLAAKYVIAGGLGHHFYLEDLRAALVQADALDASRALIARVSASLKAKGIRLLVVPVPTKVETYPELFGGRNVPDLSVSKNRFLQGLDSLGVDYLDLREAFFAAKDSVRLFPRTDTHWDQAAIRLAAALIATRIAARIDFRGTAPLAGSIRPHGNPIGEAGLIDTTWAGFQGDLDEKFRLADTDTVRLQRVGDGRGGFLAEPDSADILLYGDSFLRQYARHSAHLGAHLSREIGAPVKTVYSLKGFVEGPDRIRELMKAFPRTRVVVWVFTSRSLMEVTF